MIRDHYQTIDSWDRHLAPPTDGNEIYPRQPVAPTMSVMRKSSCACGGGCPACQSNAGDLKISQPTDAAEIEADRLADRVLHAQHPTQQPGLSSREGIGRPAAQVNRKCESSAADRGQAVERKAVSPASSAATVATPLVREALSSGGAPIDAQTLGFFEDRLGLDLRNVRVHTDSAAVRSAQAISARAYTLGSDIVFGKGEYHPTTESGQELLAHELAHVAQEHASPGVIRRKVVEDQIHGPILDDFSAETGIPRDEASHHSKEYEEWLAEKHAGADEFENFTLEAKHLKIPQVIRRFERMSLEEIYNYRQNYMFEEKGPKDPAVIKYLTDLMTSRPLQGCSKEEVKETDDLTKQIMKDVPAKVDNAVKAVTKLLSLWINNKPDLLAKRSKFRGEVACAFISNFNVNETDSSFGTTAIRLERRLLNLQKRIARPVSFTCEPINQKICLEAKGRDADGFVINHKEPIHLCFGFRDGLLGFQEATIIHELLHLLPGLGDGGGYATLSTLARTCKQGFQFSATPDILANTADAITGFIMHIDNTSSTDLKVVPF